MSMENSAPALGLIIDDPKPTTVENPPKPKVIVRHRSKVDSELEEIFKTNAWHSALYVVACTLTIMIIDQDRHEFDFARFASCAAWFVVFLLVALLPNIFLIDLIRTGKGEKVRRLCRFKAMRFYLKLHWHTRYQVTELLQRMELEEKRCSV